MQVQTVGLASNVIRGFGVQEEKFRIPVRLIRLQMHQALVLTIVFVSRDGMDPVALVRPYAVTHTW